MQHGVDVVEDIPFVKGGRLAVELGGGGASAPGTCAPAPNR